MSEIYGTFSTAYVEAMRLRLSALEPENKGLSARVEDLVAENKTLRDRFSDADTERNAAQAGLKAAFARLAELEAENKNLSNRAELADGDVKKAHAILDASDTYIRRIEVELQSESQAKIDAEFHVAALKERLAELEARCKRMQEIGDMIVDEYMVEKAEKDAWEQAKEARP